MRVSIIIVMMRHNVSNREQLAICMRWVDKGCSMHEDFITVLVDEM